MLDLWRGRITPRQVLNIVDRLPRDSHFMAALADDDDLAEYLAEQMDERKPASPPLTAWSEPVEKLTIIANRLGELIAATAAAGSGKKAKPPKPLLRPVTAHERHRRRARDSKHDLILARLEQARTAGRASMAGA